MVYGDVTNATIALLERLALPPGSSTPAGPEIEGVVERLTMPRSGLVLSQAFREPICVDIVALDEASSDRAQTGD
jgi:hypothetical protein